MCPNPSKEELGENMGLWNGSWMNLYHSIFPLPLDVLDRTFISSFCILPPLRPFSSLMSQVVNTESSLVLMFWQLCYTFQLSPEICHCYRSTPFSLLCSGNSNLEINCCQHTCPCSTFVPTDVLRHLLWAQTINLTMVTEYPMTHHYILSEMTGKEKSQQSHIIAPIIWKHNLSCWWYFLWQWVRIRVSRKEMSSYESRSEEVSADRFTYVTVKFIMISTCFAWKTIKWYDLGFQMEMVWGHLL